MENQAMAGMMAGCLAQARVRKKKGYEMARSTDAEQIVGLKKQIETLTTKIEAQNLLIKVMRTMPGMRCVGVKDDVTKVSSRAKKKNRQSADKQALDEQNGISGAADGDGANAS